MGTPAYAAPEVFKQAYTALVDVWSFGVILYCLLSGSLPFDGATAKDVVKSVRKARYSLEGSTWESVSDSAKDLIRGLLVKDPQARLNSAQALGHKWIWDLAPNASEQPLGANVIDGLRSLCVENRNARKILLGLKCS